MPIKYDPGPRSFLLCNYSLGGFKPPEMVKRRPVVVLSPRLRHRSGLLTVVPLSTTAPEPVCGHHCEMTLSEPLPGFTATRCWVKAGMVATVAFARLDLFRTGRDADGKRQYLKTKMTAEDFEAVKQCVRAALGL